MLLGVVTYNVLKDWDLDTILTKLEQAGYSAVELRTGHKHGVELSLDAAGRERVKSRFAALTELTTAVSGWLISCARAAAI